ncbi:MAG: 4Fe-4S dicluster domain-containing protein [Bacteroidetes bacterium]|nr:4Fe-4S dicluster domain-containing protein [Bacteroidota bacterium]MCW5896160.1 4Fe-4S dicluster domain-containing protein [Bacteroidota bacterium]
MIIIEFTHLDELFSALRKREYTIIGPVARDGAIALDVIYSASDLPKGHHDEQQPGTYFLRHENDEALFGYVVGPQSWKKYLYPPRMKLFSASRAGKGFEILPDSVTPPSKYAFVGVRPCEISAMVINDAVFDGGQFTDARYVSTRKGSCVIAVNCTRSGGNCFCASMNTGPRATHAFDLSMTEICENGTHHFVVEVGSELGQSILDEVKHRKAEKSEMERALELLSTTATGMAKSLVTEGLPQLLNDNYEHPEWDDVAKRCLACANCTLVCPTCFCSTVDDITDLTGDHAERWKRWDSCFTSDFTRIAGGNIRMSTRARYRQWMMHKLAHWHDQFGTSGCVGCGRCITWCPVGIDITHEAQRIRETSISTINT